MVAGSAGTGQACPVAGPEPTEERGRSVVDFEALWSSYTELRTPGVLKGSVYGRLDPAVFTLRKSILETFVRDLLEDDEVEAMALDAKKMALRRLARALWKGYLLVLASDRAFGRETLLGPRLVDPSYLRSSYANVAARHLSERHGFPASAAMSRALELVIRYEQDKLDEELPGLGVAGERLREAVERLVRCGYLMALVQMSCLGQGIRFAEPAEPSRTPVW